MRPNDPPRIATWMLEHLTPGKKNEALAGDLLEEFKRGRTATWYWRQVVTAIILGFARELRTQWPAIVYATLWTIPVPAYLILAVFRNLGETPFFARRWHWAWPYSTIGDIVLFYGAGLIYIWCALILYFLLFSLATRSINLHRLARSLWKSVFVFVAVNVGAMALFLLLPEPAHHTYQIGHDITALHLMTESLFLWYRVPFFFTLLMSIWMTLSGGDQRATTAVA